MSAPSVSVVMPVFDRADLVRGAIASVQRQAGADLEIVVVDDGSTDATADTVQRMADDDARIRLLRTPHAGPAAARNAGVDSARGEYLTFLDSDDLCPPGRIERQLTKLAGRDDVAAVVGAVQFFEEVDTAGEPRPEPRHVPFHNATLQSTTLRTEEWHRLGALDETLAFAEDVDFFLRLLEADSRLILEPEIACFYRVHGGNMTRDLQAKQQGYVGAYARSLARRRAAGRTRPLARFFPRELDREVEFGGFHELQALHLPAEPPSLAPFLNGFYLRYWRDLTGLASLVLRVEASGTGTVRIGHHDPDRTRSVVGEATVDGPRAPVSIEIDLGDPARAGVLHVEPEDGVTLHSGAWTTSDAPRRDVALAVVICSFAKPAAVRENIERLQGSGARLIVVHQGPAELDVPEGVTVLRQRNLGGSGGFARGMIEALAGGASHVLVMDDDVRVDPELPNRLRALLERLERPVTVGGQMLDLLDPATLSVSHESVDFERMRLVNPYRDLDLGVPGAPDLFARRHTSEYNGWWCCAIPAETLRAGLHLPMFVRHDDVEYGLRTTRSGSEVVTMPGIFVWHEPFATKVKPWYTYYDFRNKLILAALHGPRSGRASASWILRTCLGAVRVGRHHLCLAACRATRDFLAGPEVVFSDPVERHREVVASVAHHALQTARGQRVRASAGRRRGLLRREVVAPAVTALRETMACSWLLLRHGSRVSARYRATREHYGSEAFWREYLGMES